MSFEVIIDGIKFVAGQKQVDEFLQEVAFIFSMELDGACNIQIICDSDKMIEYIINYLRKCIVGLDVCNLGENKSDSIMALSDSLKQKPMLVYGFESYTDFLQSEYFDNRMAVVCGKECKEAQKRVYTAIEMGRDSLFAAFKTKAIFIFSDREYNTFINVADDFVSYYPECFDFNRILLTKDREFGNLFEYYNYYKKGLKVISKNLFTDKF